MVIGIVGKKQTGKSTVASMLQYFIQTKRLGYVPSFEVWKGWVGIKEEQYPNLPPPDIRILPFAGRLKEMLVTFLGLKGGVEALDKAKTEPNNLGITNPNTWQPYTNRELMQKVGTECFRNIISSSAWIKTWEQDYNAMGNPEVIVPDVRFPNEAVSLAVKGADFIHIVKNTGDKDLHLSEQTSNILEGINRPIYRLENNGTLEELFDKVPDIINYFGYDLTGESE